MASQIEVVVRSLDGGQTWMAEVDGKPVLRRASRAPLFDAARVLEANGVSANTVLAMRRAQKDGSLSEVSMMATVGVAAKMSISETEKHGPRFAKWAPNPMFAKG